MKNASFYKKHILPILLLLCFLYSPAQEKSPTITVEGMSKTTTKPNIATFTLTIRTSRNSYNETVENLIERVNTLTNVLKKLKFEEDKIYTTNFNINKKYAYNKGERIEKGFDGIQTLSVQFPQNEKKILTTLNKVAESSAETEIQISFELGEAQKKAIQEELIQKAVKDAYKKAELMANAAGYQIVGISSLRHQKNAYHHREASPMMATGLSRASSDAMELSHLNASDVVITENVHVIYNIEKR